MNITIVSVAIIAGSITFLWVYTAFKKKEWMGRSGGGSGGRSMGGPSTGRGSGPMGLSGGAMSGRGGMRLFGHHPGFGGRLGGHLGWHGHRYPRSRWWYGRNYSTSPSWPWWWSFWYDPYYYIDDPRYDNIIDDPHNCFGRYKEAIDSGIPKSEAIKLLDKCV